MKKKVTSNNNKKNMLGVFFKGIVMGIADIIPGVSGGTMALIMGIYERLIVAMGSIGNINVQDVKQRGFFKSMINRNTSFLFVLGLGMMTSIFLLSGFIRQASTTEPVLFWSFFMGLILASFMVMLSQVKPFSIVKIILLAASTGVTVFLVNYLDLKPMELTPMFYFIAGVGASFAMILPGISGAFILLLLGVYFPVLEMLRGVSLQASDFFRGIPASEHFHNDLKNLAFLGSGIIVGLLVFSRVLKLLISVAKPYVIVVLNGLILGTLDKLWPWKVVVQTKVTSRGIEIPMTYQNISPMYYEGDTRVIFSVVMLCIGMLLVILVDSYAKKRAKVKEQQSLENEGGSGYTSKEVQKSDDTIRDIPASEQNQDDISIGSFSNESEGMGRSDLRDGSTFDKQPDHNS